MRIGATGLGAMAATLMLTAAALAMPAGALKAGAGDTLGTLPVQAEPEIVPGPDVEELLPPPILPAPDLPGGDPVVELPPEDAPPAPGLSPTGPIFSFADLAEELLDTVVRISTSQRVTLPQRRTTPSPETPKTPEGKDFFEDFFDNDGGNQGSRNVQSLGAGFVIDDTGLIVTNNHVIADADEITANFANGGQLVAKVIGVDEKTDLALLQVTPSSQLKPARFGRSEHLRVGDWVLAIGNPFGFGGTVTAGIVSALDRDIQSGPYDHYIQTDASINRGNSGGPLFNIDGEVVGINTAIMSPTGGSIGIGFAVPTEIAVPVIEQLRRFGSVRRGWIGVKIQDVTDEVAESRGMETAMGALIAGLTEDGPAAKAGIEDGDVVVEFNGKPVESMRELPRLVADTPPGDTVNVVVMREGERLTLEVEIGLLEDEKKVAAAAPAGSEEGEATAPVEDAAQVFGLKLDAITDELRRAFSIDAGVEGVLVAEVKDGSEAEVKGVRPGEVIVQVSQWEVKAPEDVVARIEELRAEGRRTVMLLLSSEGNKLRHVSLRFEDEPAQPKQ
ncbi:MAG: Do family serine endopeptidase [Propylenella sp.]